MTTPDDLPGYDTLPWPEDAVAVWWEASDDAKETVRRVLPELAAALDRGTEIVKVPRHQRRARRLTPPDQRRRVPWQERDEGSER